MNVGSVFSAISIAGAVLLLGACSSRDPTSFGSTIGNSGTGPAASSGAGVSGVSLAAIGAALGFQSRDLLECPREPVPAYGVSTFLPEPKIDRSMSLGQIGRLMKVDDRHMALGATQSHEVVFALMSVGTQKTPSGGACAYPTHIALTLALTARKIHVAKDFAQGEPCVYDEVLAHEKRHAALDDKLMGIAANALRIAAPKRFANLYGVWGANENAARQNLQRRLESDDEDLRVEIERKRVETQADEIDTAAERHRLVQACGGRLEKLYPGYM